MTYNVFSGTLNPTHFTSLGECLRNDLFCVEWDVKPQLNQSSQFGVG